MYENSIKAENKIIKSEDLYEIFSLMNETLKKYKKVSEREDAMNKTLDYAYQNYTFKDEGSKIKASVNFYDNTDITFDNFDNFLSIFNARLEEIKNIDVYFTLSYSVKTPEPNKSYDSFYQTINMYIRDDKLDISLNLKSDDDKLTEIYSLIKNKILNAPEKYDFIIKKKNKITNTVSFGAGIIPSVIITSIFLFIPKINNIFLHGYVVYPICILFLTFIIGSMISSSKLDKYYKNIMPEKKYAGWDSKNSKSIYKDDIESYIGTSDILIGKKVNNLKNRQIIYKEYKKYKKNLTEEIVGLIIISVIVLIIGLFI